MKFSYVTLPDYPIQESIDTIRKADELGYHAVYSVDETWHKDLWVLFAAAADKTKNIRFGPNLTPIGLREPTHVVQALATLDEVTGGRTECVFSIGNYGLLSKYGRDWSQMKPLSRVKEAHHVMRTFLDDGAITYDGDFYKYAGLFTFARPVQERVPLIIGAWCVTVCAPDSDEAKRTARTMVAFYISSMPHEQLERHGIDPAEMAPIVEALGKGELDKAYELTTPEVADKLSIAGSPEECVAKIKDIESAGVNHMILCITDPAIVKAFTQKDVSVPDVKGQLQLIHDEVMPAFA